MAKKRRKEISTDVVSQESAKKEATSTDTTESAQTETPAKQGKFKRLVHNKVFWRIVFALFIFFSFTGWLFSTYEPPFPPRWIGVKYYSFTAQEPLKLNELNALDESLKTIQTAVLMLEPVSPEAKRLLPAEFAVNTFTLSDTDILRSQLADSLAQRLTGIKPEDRFAARQILANPESAVKLKQVAVAVTSSPNATTAEQAFNEKIGAVAQEITPSVFDEIQDKVQLAAKVSPAGADILTADANKVQVDKHSAYYLYENEVDSTASVTATLRKPFDTFVELNNTLVPVRGGRSTLLLLDPGQYTLSTDAVLMPVTYYFAVQTVEGLPYNRKSVGHGWTTVAREENGRMYPMMTLSLFNFIDGDNAQNVDQGELTNIATYTNLWVNHPDDWTRAVKSLNRIPLPDGPSRSDLNEISPEVARDILLLRSWYLPQYSTQDQYMEYLVDSFDASTNLTNKLALGIEIVQVKIQNVMNESFWGAIQMWMNQGYTETSYNGITSNCVAYSTDFWNFSGETPQYDPRMLKLVAVPGKLYHDMNPDEVIDLPDAEKLPLDQQNVPYAK